MRNQKPLVIIMGAGASHDYVYPTSAPGGFVAPPITDDIVDRYFLERIETFSDYPDVEDAISFIAPRVKPVDPALKRWSLEECLSTFPSKNQLIAFRFYLKELFEFISNSYFSRNNYKALKDRIIQGGFQACVATFNYDTLFEQSIGGGQWKELNDYTRGDIKIVKLHGSCDWSYIRNRNLEDEKWTGIANSFEYLKQHPDTPMEQLYHDRYILERWQAKQLHRFPALAIPATETKEFICPEDHIQVLSNFLKFTDKILIIGWKAGDSTFINFLEGCIKKPTSVAIVSGSSEGIKVIKGKLEHIENLNLNFIEKEGFSNFINSDECLTFFET